MCGVALALLVACRVYAPVVITTTVCVEAEVAGLLTAKAAEELARATDACLDRGRDEAVKRATNPDAGPAEVAHHSRLVQLLLDEIARRRHRDGGTR